MNIQQINAAAARIKNVYPDALCQKTEKGVSVDFGDETMNCVFYLEKGYCPLAFRGAETTYVLFWKSSELELVLAALSCARKTEKSLDDVYYWLRHWYLS